MQATPWLIREPKKHPALRLFCFCYAGGNALAYLPWQAEFGAQVEICAVQLPGRGARLNEAPFTSLPALVRVLAPIIAQRSEVPFAFFGHSLGALLAFEIARFCKLNYLPSPRHLFVSGCNAPQQRGAREGLHRLPDDVLIEKLRDYNGTPPEVLAHRELLELVLPTLRADFALVEDYVYRPGLQLTVPITVLAGRGDVHCPPEQVAAWRKETVDACQVHWFDGDHFFIHSARAAVIDCIAAELDERLCA